MVELEYKFKLADKISFISMLNKLTVPEFSRQYQKSVMYDNPAKLMQRTNGRIRLRQLGENGTKQLTYKLPLKIKSDKLKREIEHQIEFTDIGNMEKILAAMEFTPSSSYERYQTAWVVDSCLVTLDEYPFGDFVEIEGKESSVKRLANELGFTKDDALASPIDSIFQEWRRSNKLPFTPHMTFESFNK